MAQIDDGDDVRAIRSIIDQQFRSLAWSRGGRGAWSTFAADFFPNASLYPAARPASRQTVEAFLDRMQGLAQTSLRTFREQMLGSEVLVFGSVAVAMAGCEIIENDDKRTRGVEAMLLIKDDGLWKIVAQAWDMENPEKPIPGRLLSQHDDQSAN